MPISSLYEKKPILDNLMDQSHRSTLLMILRGLPPPSTAPEEIPWTTYSMSTYGEPSPFSHRGYGCYGQPAFTYLPDGWNRCVHPVCVPLGHCPIPIIVSQGPSNLPPSTLYIAGSSPDLQPQFSNFGMNPYFTGTAVSCGGDQTLPSVCIPSSHPYEPPILPPPYLTHGYKSGPSNTEHYQGSTYPIQGENLTLAFPSEQPVMVATPFSQLSLYPQEGPWSSYGKASAEQDKPKWPPSPHSSTSSVPWQQPFNPFQT
ncbi:hypothetical protein M231_04698 [Tremella mesenterica]|uniref:Uncharacterized protein n=1 Tax=Tremella mesenterica TaxID=5217 RepID=A0A4Q1BJW0_TREME|nr:hypothetical protein M231_04698 [Tremella mesenterica]